MTTAALFFIFYTIVHAVYFNSKERFIPITLFFVATALLLQTFSSTGYNYVIFESLINRYQNPDYSTGDWYLNVSQHLNGYFIFTRLLAFAPPGWLHSCYALIWLSSVAGLGWALLHLTESLTKPQKAAWVACACIVFLLATFRMERFGGFALGDNAAIYNFLHPQTPALALACFGLAAGVQGRSFRAGLFVGLATLLHLNTGQHFLLVVTPALYFAGIDWRRITLFVIVSLVIGSPHTIPALMDIVGQQSTTAEFSYIESSAYLRHPHHLVPSSWPFSVYIKAVSFWLIGSFAIGLRRTLLPIDRALIAILIVSFLGLIASYVFVELYPVDFVAKSQLSRLSIVIKIIFSLYIALAFCELAVKLSGNLKSSFLNAVGMKIGGFFRAKGAISIIIAIVTISASFRPHTVTETEIGRLEERLQETIPHSAVVIVPPRDSTFADFPVSVGRGLFVDEKRFPFQGRLGSEWTERICALIAAECENASGPDLLRLRRENWQRRFYDAPAEHWLSVAQRYGATHIIREHDPNWEGLTLLDVFDDYALYQLRSD